MEAAIAAAKRVTPAKLVPSQQATIDTAYQDAWATLSDGPAKSAGIAAGDKAALAVLALRAEDRFPTPESYRPRTTPGVYAPTVIPAFSQWPQRRPWLMTSPAQFRPDPPPRLASATWARDYNEIKSIGGARSARLFAAVTQAVDDAMIAIFDTKYRYNFWRPITAIRNGDIDGNHATERDPEWTLPPRRTSDSVIPRVPRSSGAALARKPLMQTARLRVVAGVIATKRQRPGDVGIAGPLCEHPTGWGRRALTYRIIRDADVVCAVPNTDRNRRGWPANGLACQEHITRG